MKRFDGKRWIAAGLAGMMTAAMPITSFTENGWTRISLRSAWDGTYYRSDGQRVTVTDTRSEIYGRNADQGGNEDFVLLAVKNAFVNNGYLYNIQVAADP